MTPLLAQILSELLRQPVSVKLAVGRPRIIEPWGDTGRREASTLDIRWPNPALGSLFEHYGDMIGIVNHHPVFVKASTPMAQGGWDIFPAILTNACKDFGVLSVLNGLRDIANKPHVTRPRAYFLRCLKAGVYGHKLSTGASIIGPISR